MHSSIQNSRWELTVKSLSGMRENHFSDHQPFFMFPLPINVINKCIKITSASQYEEKRYEDCNLNT